MNKKLILSLAPLLATAAFAVMPAAAQAAPHHWYNNGVLIPEGQRVPTVSWGTLALESAAGKVECRTVIGGYVENPVGGGAGVGAIQAFNEYECTSTCPVEVEHIAEGLPWRTELIEVSTKSRDRTVGMKIRIKCEYPKPGTVYENTVFSGSNDPLEQNGTALGKPSQVVYAGTGEEELVSPELGKSKTEGRVKTQGYEATEVITNK
jgi:hypothetical protein